MSVWKRTTNQKMHLEQSEVKNTAKNSINTDFSPESHMQDTTISAFCVHKESRLL